MIVEYYNIIKIRSKILNLYNFPTKKNSAWNPDNIKSTFQTSNNVETWHDYSKGYQQPYFFLFLFFGLGLEV